MCFPSSFVPIHHARTLIIENTRATELIVEYSDIPLFMPSLMCLGFPFTSYILALFLFYAIVPSVLFIINCNNANNILKFHIKEYHLFLRNNFRFVLQIFDYDRILYEKIMKYREIYAK